MNIMEARVYVGTWGKYNNGSLKGAWLDLADYSDKNEFHEACRELHKDEYDPEFMYQDWENVPAELIDEAWISDKIFDMCKAVMDLGDTEQQAFFVYVNHCVYNLAKEDVDMEELVQDFWDVYQGEYDDEVDFAYQLIEECYSDMPDFAKQYFDYEKFARDLFMCDYRWDDGFVFRAA